MINSLEKKTPKEPSRADTSKLSRSDTAENLAQENIEGVWNTPCKTKETQLGRIQLHQKAGTYIGGEAALLPTPRRAALTNARKIM